MDSKTKVLEIRNARMLFRNFRGEKSAFNTSGQRSFSVVIDDPGLAEELKNDGWNVKFKEANDSFDSIYLMPVSVRFDPFPPDIYVKSNKRGSARQKLDEDTAEMVDFLDIENVNLVITGYEWELNGKCGIKAYLKSAYITFRTDSFAEEFMED